MLYGVHRSYQASRYSPYLPPLYRVYTAYRLYILREGVYFIVISPK
nr:MAG TPA: hypothetical protein [Caudoviricetes sp.]